VVLELRDDLDKAGRERETRQLMDELQVNHVADRSCQPLGRRAPRVEIAARWPASHG